VEYLRFLMKTRFYKTPTPWLLFFVMTAGLLSLHDGGLWAAELPRMQLRTYLHQGIDKGFDLDEKGAVAELTKAEEFDRENPLGYAFLGFSHLFFYELSCDEKERERNRDTMLRFVSEALAKGEKRVENHPEDGDAFFAMAVAELVKVRWDVTCKNYLTAARGAQSTREYLEKALKLDPENFDIYFPLGLLDYHIGHLPGFTRFLSTFFVRSEGREKGLQELELAAKKGDLLKDLAKAELLSAFVNFEKKPERALPLAQELNERFPRNYNILFALANVKSELGLSEEALSVAQVIENGIKSGTPPFRPELWPRYFQLLGRIYFDRKEYPEASEYLNRALQDNAPHNARVRAWALVRLGMICDIRQERTRAEEYYRKALEVPGGEGTAQVAAKQYLRIPYSPGKPKMKARS
jgi:tetratricopeptide (TPR) repeat protein